MKSYLRPFTCFALVLLLGYASVVLATARGQAPAVGEMVICSGFGTHVVQVDANGNPTGPAHICPDGVASFVSVDAPVPVLPLRRIANGEVLSVKRAVALAQAARLRATARGPPSVA